MFDIFLTYLKAISIEFQIPLDTLLQKFTLVLSTPISYDSVRITFEDDEEEKKEKKEKKKKKKEVKKEKKVKRCQYEFTRGNRYRQQGEKCGKPIEDGNEGKFCKLHSKVSIPKPTSLLEKEKKVEKEEKKVEKVEKIEKKIDMKDIEKMPKMNYRIHRFVHNQTGLTFFSKDEPVVFARWDKEKEKLFPLDDDMIELCIQHKFRYNPSKWDEWRRQVTLENSEDD